MSDPKPLWTPIGRPTVVKAWPGEADSIIRLSRCAKCGAARGVLDDEIATLTTESDCGPNCTPEVKILRIAKALTPANPDAAQIAKPVVVREATKPAAPTYHRYHGGSPCKPSPLDAVIASRALKPPGKANLL